MDGHAIQSDVLWLATDAAAAAIAESLDLARAAGRPLLVVDRPAEAMREFLRTRPRWVVVLIANESHRPVVSLLVLLHRRRAAVIALVERHSDLIERAVRSAGVACYLALDSPGDVATLERMLDVAGVPPPRRSASRQPTLGLDVP